MAIVITPLEQLQDLILAQGFEADYDDIENDWARWQYESGRAINQTLKSVKKAIRKGALYAELEDVFSNTLSVLHLAGLASDMSFRSSALTSSHYACSEPYLLNQQRLERKNARHKQNALGNTH